jgi:L-ascorbate metabolism protein UlaG (beta-lactamase superfamily)
VKEAWEKNHSLQIYSTKETIEILREMELPMENLHQVADGDVLEVGLARIKFLKSVHEGSQYADIENLSLLITYDEKKVVVTGDAMPCETFFQNIQKWDQQIDWLFAPFPYVGLRSTRKLLAKYLDIQNIYVLHLPRKEADAQNWIENTKRICENAKDGLVMPVFPDIIR